MTALITVSSEEMTSHEQMKGHYTNLINRIIITKAMVVVHRGQRMATEDIIISSIRHIMLVIKEDMEVMANKTIKVSFNKTLIK